MKRRNATSNVPPNGFITPEWQGRIVLIAFGFAAVILVDSVVRWMI